MFIWVCECLTPFHLQGTWKCKGAESGTVFDDVEFEDGRWDDYDEKVSKTGAECMNAFYKANLN